MRTPYQGPARIGDRQADVDIANVDVSRWKGTATNVDGVLAVDEEAIVTLLEQPRPGWSARAVATGGADGVLHLEGIGQYFAPPLSSVAQAERSLWVRKLPRAT
jgi:hypothetical protein